jgi:hypothetical protein
MFDNPYIHNTVVQEVYNRDHSPEVEDVDNDCYKYLELVKSKQKDKAEN